MPFFRDYHRTVVGYHGTRRETALRIVSGESTFRQSNNDDDWLGHGVYFWEYAPEQAWAWARKRYAKGTQIAVLGAMIRLGNCLDLLDPKNSKALVSLKNKLVADSAAAGVSLKKNYNSRKYYDCSVLEYAYAAYDQAESQPIDSARAVYVPTQGKERLWNSSWLYHETHVQLCVRNSECILGTWLAREAAK